MDIKVPRGKYVLAVSGGVDSMTLLDLLSNLPGVELVVAHFNHGIRTDSAEDEKLVAKEASRYCWPLETGRGGLRPNTSEDTARRARYEFLEDVRQNHKAQKIITAHHQDDLIETALLNLLRGTGRRGLTAMADNPEVLRPLLNTPKAEIISYARQKKLAWCEDSTNQSTDHLRNYLRINVLPGLTQEQREGLLVNLDKIRRLNLKIDSRIAVLARQIRSSANVNRQAFAALPDKIADELLVYWLRTGQLGEIDSYEVSRLKLALKTAKPDTEHAVKGPFRLRIGASTASFQITP